MAASFTNDLYGGLNYYKIANEFQSRWLRELALQAVSPSGRLVMRLALFAPDWTISTTRAFVKGFGPQATAVAAGAVVGSQVFTQIEKERLQGKSDVGFWTGAAAGGLLGLGVAKAGGFRGGGGTGWKGALPSELGGRPANLVDLHRQYFLRSALIYTTLVDTVNYQMSGHHFWENKDPTRLDLGDGRTMQASKHFMEPFHWLMDPRKQAMGKASFLVKESASQLEDKEFWSPHGAPRMGGAPKDVEVSLPTRIGHAARQFAPISAQGMELSNPQSALWSMAGMPIYGRKIEDMLAAKEALKQLHASPEYQELKRLRAEKKARDKQGGR